MNLLPLISVTKHKLALPGELSIPQWQIGLLEWELENALEAFIVKLILYLSPLRFFSPAHSFHPLWGGGRG